jgi:DNA-binding transcriptional ArsR family regulator
MPPPIMAIPAAITSLAKAAAEQHADGVGRADSEFAGDQAPGQGAEGHQSPAEHPVGAVDPPEQVRWHHALAHAHGHDAPHGGGEPVQREQHAQHYGVRADPDGREDEDVGTEWGEHGRQCPDAGHDGSAGHAAEHAADGGPGEEQAMIKLHTTTQTTLRYPARGAGTLWETGTRPAPGSTVRLLGRRRAELLETLRSPSTATDLAQALRVSPSAVSQHLRVLRESGLVAGGRSGRSVHYRTTERGLALLDPDTR